LLSRVTDILKLFARKFIYQKGKGTANDPKTTAKNETRAFAKFSEAGGHRNVVKVYRMGQIEENGQFFFDMELCDKNLAQFLSNGHRPNSSKIWGIMKDIASGLAFIHQQKEIHRDLKPENGKVIHGDGLTGI
jgi:eukaryotic-like serine/threonine-protein kinase